MSLVSRLAGVPEAGQSPDDVEKIGFSQFTSALREIHRGNLTQAGVVAAFNLDAGETTQATNFYQSMVALPNNAQREAFLVELQQVFHLSELGVDDSANGGTNYTDLTELTARIQAI